MATPVNTAGLQAAYDRKVAGKANAADVANLDYATKNALWSPNNLPKATGGASAAPTATNTMKGYDTNNGGKEVYVQPGKYTAGISATPYKDTKQMDADINAGQAGDQAKKDAELNGAPGTKKGLADYKSEVTTEMTTKAPTAPDFTKTYTDLQHQYGTDTLETKMTDLQNEENTIRANQRARKANYEDKTVALGVISGKTSEIDRQTQETLDANLREQAYTSNTLKNKYDIVNNIMNLKKADYETAKAAYDTEFSQNMSLINYMKADEASKQSIEDKKADNARADATIMYNAISNGLTDFKSATPSQKANLNKLEVQSGLPVGFFEGLQSKILDQTVKYIGTANNSSGGQSAYVLTQDKNGALKTVEVPMASSVTTKTTKATGSGTTSSTKVSAANLKNAKDVTLKAINAYAGGDGYVSPDTFNSARGQWVQQGFNVKDFDSTFSKYKNPKQAGYVTDTKKTTTGRTI